jgi:hypothetical protein
MIYTTNTFQKVVGVAKHVTGSTYAIQHRWISDVLGSRFVQSRVVGQLGMGQMMDITHPYPEYFEISEEMFLLHLLGERI